MQHWFGESGQQPRWQPFAASTFGAEKVAPAARARAAVSNMSFLRIGTPFVVGTTDAAPSFSARRSPKRDRIRFELPPPPRYTRNPKPRRGDAMKIPGLILKQMYTLGSLENVEDGVQFSLKNRLSNATVVGLSEVRINGRAVPLDRLTLEMNGERVAASSISPTAAIAFPLARTVTIHARGDQLAKGQHEIALDFEATPFGALSFKVKDAISEKVKRTAVPHDKDNDYSPEIVRARQKFVEEYAGVKLRHIDKFSFDPSAAKGTIENFTGVAP